MKENFLKYAEKKIRNKYKNYDDNKIEIILYGLEAIYIMFTKTVIIFSIAFFLNVIKQTFYILFFYSILRLTCFGMHAKKSIQCYILSFLLFIITAIICKFYNIPYIIKLIISILSIITITLYAPADTNKRPLLNKKKRKIFKIISVINSLIYFIIILFFEDNIVSEYLTMGVLDASLMIHPLTYRMFHLPYNNYKNYNN